MLFIKKNYKKCSEEINTSIVFVIVFNAKTYYKTLYVFVAKTLELFKRAKNIKF